MFRRTISMTSFLSFVIMLLTSVVLYIEPHGRVAYWADWTFMGLSKTQWDQLHLTTGVLFLVCGVLHVWQNWSAIMTYMKNKARDLVVVTPPTVFALLISVFVVGGTLLGLPPMQQIVDLGGYIKDAQTERHGNPPFGHAELASLEKFCGFLGLDAQKAFDALKKAGFVVEDTYQSVADIARANGKSPQDVYVAIRVALAGADPFSALPSTPPEGTGKMTLDSLCTSYGLDLEAAQARLASAGVKAQPGQTIKQIATANSMAPAEVYSLIRTGQN